VARSIDKHVEQPHICTVFGPEFRHTRGCSEALETSNRGNDGIGGQARCDEEALVARRCRPACVSDAVDEQACEPPIDLERRGGRLRLSDNVGDPQCDAAMNARIELDPNTR
jgi:hypothetical protein